MARFNFPLQSLLQIKEKLEGQCQMEYGKAVKDRDLQVIELNRIKKLISDESHGFYQKQKGVFQVKDLIALGNKIRFLKAKEQAGQDRLLELEDMVQAKRQALAQAMRERKMYDSLRQKAMEAHYEEEKHEELKQMDEQASFNHSRE